MTAAQINGTVPRHPILGWDTFAGHRTADLPSILEHRHFVYTTSGRAAIALALRLLGVGPGDRVLVPTYHCPTMISPVVKLGAVPVFFPVTASGAPSIEFLAAVDLARVRAMLVAHYFGLTQPLSRVRAFCDERGIALIEDCAHAFFGKVEGRSVGGWGDFAIASLTKFFPVTEGGCLVSNRYPLADDQLLPRGTTAEAKALFDAVELGARHRRFPGVNALLRGAFGLKELARGRRFTQADPEVEEPMAVPSVDELSDALIGSRITRASELIVRSAHRSRIVALRQRNYRLLAESLVGLRNAAPFQMELPAMAAPYVLPLRVAHPADRYRALRALKLPLFRWDRVWPGTPALAGDHGPAWSSEMFQLGCHQDLSEPEIRFVAAAVRRIFEQVT